MTFETIALIDKNENKVYFGDYGVFLGTISGGLPSTNFLPSSDNIIEEVPRMDGAYFFGKKLKPRQITLNFFFEDKTEHELNTIKKLFYCREPHKLINDYYPYKYLWVVSDDSEVNMDYIWDGYRYTGFLEVNYIAHDPLFYSVYSSLSTSGSVIENITSKGVIRLFNKGNYESKCVIKLVGSGTNITVKNLKDGSTFTISLMSNETIYIDGIRGQIRNATTLKTSLFSGDFILIHPYDNTIEVDGTNLNLTEVSFDYRYTYI